MKTFKLDNQTYHCYVVEPIDWGHECMHTLEAYEASLAQFYAGKPAADISRKLENHRRVLAAGKECCRRLGWQGDVRGGEIFVFGVPMMNHMAAAYTWSQDKKGQAYVVSPASLPWVRKLNYFY